MKISQPASQPASLLYPAHRGVRYEVLTMMKTPLHDQHRLTKVMPNVPFPFSFESVIALTELPSFLSFFLRLGNNDG